MIRGVVFAICLVLLPACALAAEPQALELTAKATVDGTAVPLTFTAQTDNTNVVLSSQNQDGATPVTVTLYITSKPKPKPAPTSTQMAAVDSSQGIQSSISNVSPQVAGVVAPVFSALDGVRESIANVTDAQIAATKPKISSNPLGGTVEGAQTEAPSTQNWLWSIVYTIYFYILTLIRFLVGSAAIFYPVAAILFLYFLYRMFRVFARR